MLQNIPLDQISSKMDGKLLLYDELPFDEEIITTLHSKHFLLTKPAIQRTFLSLTCMRCGNKDGRLFGKIPCKRCSKIHFYCRNCIQMGRVMECDMLYFWDGPPADWITYEDPCAWEGSLTSAQQKAAMRITEAIENKERELLIWAVCGAGKTEMLFPGISRALEKGKRISIATPRADVVRELKPRLEHAFEKVSIQALYGGSDEKAGNAQLVIATTHQLLRYQQAFDVMVIDEVDAFPFHADPALPFAQARAEKSDCTTVYLTATPRKKFKSRIKRRKLAYCFVPVRYHGHPLPVPKLKICHSLQKDLKRNKPPNTFLSWLHHRTQPERQLLIFVPTKILAEQLKAPLTQILMKHQIIQSTDELDAVHSGDTDREEKVMAFREQRLKVIITTTILERGVTFPSVDVAILDAGHEVFDEAALVQIAGRAGRNENDPDGEVIFFHDGKTESMVEAVYTIKQMNKRGGFR